MVETWRWPNASYSVLSIWLGADAKPARGGAVDHQVGFQPLLLLVGIDVAQHRAVFAARRAASAPIRTAARRRRPAACTGRRRCSAGRRPRMSWTGSRNSLAPGTDRQRAPQPGHHRLDPRRCDSGFSATNTDAGVGLPAGAAAARPVNPTTSLHRRVVLHDLRQLPQLLPPSPGTRCSGRPACHPIRRPVSCSGKKPFGTMTYSTTFSPTVTTSTSITSRPWRSDQARLRP